MCWKADLYREVGVIIRAFSGTGADGEDERKGGHLASYPGVPAVPEAMPLKGATKWGAKPWRNIAKGPGVAAPRNVRHAGRQTQPLHGMGAPRSPGCRPSRGGRARGPRPGERGAAGELARERAGGRRGRAGRGTRRCTAASPPPVGALSGRWLRRREVGTRRRCSSAAAGTARELRSMARRAAAPGAARESPAARSAPHF